MSNQINLNFGHHLGIVDEKNKLILLWTPKAGCSMSIAIMLRQAGILNINQRYSTKEIHKNRVQFYNKYGYLNFEVPEYYDKYYIFKVIRNPYDRAVSSYLWSMKFILFCDFNYTWSFENYLIHLKANNLQICHENKILNVPTDHCQQQYVIGEEKYVRKYVHLENLENEIDEINRELNININASNLDHFIMNHYFKNIDIEDQLAYVGNINFNELPSLIPSCYKCFYNEKTRSLVEDLYKDDIRCYKYEFYK